MLATLQLTNFRCFSWTSLEAAGRSIALVGANAAGKTSVLEAIYFLARGRSFRTADRTQLVKRGTESFGISADVVDGLGPATLQMRWSRQATQLLVAGRPATGLGELATRLRLHLIEPGVHRLVEGGPIERRRLLDLGVFHVEPAYMLQWRQFRRVLKQRNAALRAGAGERQVRAWDSEFCRVAAALDEHRVRYLECWRPLFRSTAAALGLPSADLELRPGWDREEELSGALARSLARDVSAATTTVGPHRADVGLLLDRRAARRVVSRGQQKLLASALVVSQARMVAATGEMPLILLDDPGAELDVDNLGMFLSWLASLQFQVIAASTFPAALEKLGDLSWFHVKQDRIDPMV